MPPSQSPIKVPTATKEKIRYAATVRGVTQGALVAVAIDEYVERHRADFAEQIEGARVALLGGDHSAVAHMIGVTEEDIDEVAGPPASD